MAVNVSKFNVGRVRVEEEAGGSFAVDASGSIGSFKDLPVIEGTGQLQVPQESLPPGHLQQHIDGYPEELLGVKSASLSFDVNLHATGTAADSSTTSIQTALGELLKQTLGGETLAQGDTINDAGAAATDFDVSNVGRWSEGGAIGLLDSSSNMEVTEVESISSNNLVMKRNFSFTPSNGATCYNSAGYHLAENPSTSIQAAVEGINTDDRWLLLGGQHDAISFTLENGQLPRVSKTLKFASWIHAEDAGTPFNSGSVGDASYTQSPVVLMDSELLVGTVGTAARPTALKASQMTLNLNLSYVPVTSPGGTGASDIIVQWQRVRSAPVVSGSFTIPFEDETWRAHKESRTDMYWFLQIGQTAGSVVALSAPTIQIVSVDVVDVNGVSMQTVSWRGRLDEETSESTATELGQSAFRAHFL